MPYSRITRTRHGADALRYIRGDGKGHNGAKVRNEYMSGINMLPDSAVPFEAQMQPFWDKADARHTTQIDRYVVSFSKRELDPSNPADVAKGHYIGCEIARLLCNGLDPEREEDRQLAAAIGVPIEQLAGMGTHQAMVATQTDGKGGCIHVHIAQNDVAMDTLRGVNHGLYLHSNLRQVVDHVCQQYFELDQPELAAEKEPARVRGMKERNAQIEKANAAEVEQAQAEGREPVLQPLQYIWEEDLKARIREAAEAAADEDEFMTECRLRGVEVEKRRATKKQPEHYTYELTDVSGFDDAAAIPANLKRKSFKLGGNYQPDGVASMFHSRDLQAGVQTSADKPAPVAVQKPAELSPEEREQQELERAKKMARASVSTLFYRSQGWSDELPPDFDEMSRRMDAADESWNRFTAWRVEQRKAGNKLPGIFRKNGDGTISVLQDELDRQYNAFLTPVEAPRTPQNASEQSAGVSVPSAAEKTPTAATKPQKSPAEIAAERERAELERRKQRYRQRALQMEQNFAWNQKQPDTDEEYYPGK